MDKKSSTNLSEHQKAMRERTSQDVLEAIDYLEKHGIKITYKALSEHVGCHINTIKQPYIREIIHERLNVSKKPDLKAENRALKERIHKVEDRLAHSLHHNARLQEEKENLKKRADEYEYKYRKLLGQYQIDVGKKMSTF